MISAADKNLAARGLLLEMTLKAKIGVALLEHSGIDRTVNGMTGRASFAHRFMLEDEWPALGCVTLGAGVMLDGQ